MRRMMPGETYADFAAALREVVGKNKVSERVLLAQFYRCFDKTTKKLVQQPPKPKTLERAVAKATIIDDPMDNVAQGMQNIGQAWATAPSPYLIRMTGTTGQTMVIPGIGGTGLPAGMVEASQMTTTDGEAGAVVLFTNPQGVWNDYSGTWDVSLGHVWSGKYWVETMAEQKRAARNLQSQARGNPKRSERKVRNQRDTDDSDEESNVKPARKKLKAAVKQAQPQARAGGTTQPGKGASPGSYSCFNCVRSLRERVSRRRGLDAQRRTGEAAPGGDEAGGKLEANAVRGLRRSVTTGDPQHDETLVLTSADGLSKSGVVGNVQGTSMVGKIDKVMSVDYGVDAVMEGIKADALERDD
ncbi:hypothetical protein L916_16055 [Phytophthora nicotianae]|uniref:Uncharacterized protein n=1 Tax=Phytophthora nicotianae TaxID=4792 RepID=W2ICF5_PHYNI|nr:hypothetical protein L916_16055 [Phytophthora nicotianae]